MIVAFVLNVVVLGGVTVLSLLWHLPVRAGLLFVSADTFITSIGLAAYLMLLANLMHPAIAAIFALIFNAELFYDGQLWARSAIRAGNHSYGLRVMQTFFHGLYLISPILHPFSRKTENIYGSLRVMHGEWKYLLYSLGYSLALCSFCYFVALAALHRKRHI